MFEHEYADDEGLLAWMLSCGDKVTVLEPESGIIETVTESRCGQHPAENRRRKKWESYPN